MDPKSEVETASFCKNCGLITLTNRCFVYTTEIPELSCSVGVQREPNVADTGL